MLLLAASLGGCGGGDSGFGGDADSWTPGVFMPAGTFAARCVAPRSGIDPATNLPYPDVGGIRTDENNFLRSWSNDTYLWYDEIVDRNPANFATLAYFDLLKTSETTQSGNPKDRFHFTVPTDEWFQLSQSGVAAGYGAAWLLVSPTPPREVVVGYVEPTSPAAAGNIARGATVLVADGVDVVNDNTQAGVDTLNAAFFPAGPNETHTFTMRDRGAQNSRIVTMTSANVVSTPVQNAGTIQTLTGTIGYLLFNDHIATAEAALIDAVEQLAAAGIDDLMLDIRYNGGGFLDIASEMAFMVAGAAQTGGRTFERLRFNDKHPSTDPVTGEPLAPIGFHSTTQGFPGTPAGQPLPSLELSRVFVLTGPDTCSASESIMNSLLGIDVEVIQIGSTTCGKPYGFYPTDNCGTTYFTIQFQGVNDQDFGDYPDGFSPQNSVGAIGVPVPGCSVADDFSRELGDPQEGRLAAALMYRDTGQCPLPPSGFGPDRFPTAEAQAPLSAADGLMPKSPWRENRILRR